MVRDLWWVLATYLTRRTFLLVMAAALLLTGISVFTAIYARPSFMGNYPPPPRGRLLVDSAATLEAVRKGGRQAEVDAIDLGSLWRSLERTRQEEQLQRKINRLSVSEPPDSFFDVLDEFPNLRIARTGYLFLQAAVDRLATQPGLTYVAVENTGPVDLAPLAHLAALERLDLWLAKPPQGVEALAALPRLETLVVTRRTGIDDAALAAIARWPHLRTLALAFSDPDDPAYPLTPQGLQVLEQSPALETLYVGGDAPPGEIDWLPRARRELPGVDVEPAFVPQQPFLLLFVWPALAIGLGMSVVLLEQFRNPASRLAPGFVPRHALVAVGWAVLAIATSAALAWLAGMPLVLGCSLSAAVFGLALWGPTQNYVVLNKTPTRWTNVENALMGLAMPALMISLIYPATANGLVEHALVTSLVLAAASVAAVWAVVHRLRLISGADVAVKSRPRGAVQVPENFMVAAPSRERQIESWRREPEYWTWWRRIERWRVGNLPIRGTWSAIVMAIGTFAVTLLFFKMGPLRTIGWTLSEQLRSMLIYLPAMLLLFVAGRVAVNWRNRLLSLGMESLRPPYDRARLVHEWAVALVLDIVPMVLVGSAVEAVVVNIVVAWQVNWQAVPRDTVLIALGAVPATLGACAAMVVVERQWVRWLVLLLAAAVAIVSFSVITAARYTPSQVGIEQVLGQLWILGIAGGVLCVAMWQKWRYAEFDRRP